MKEYKCNVAQAGFFAGPVFVSGSDKIEMRPGDVTEETEKLVRALNAVKADMQNSADAGGASDIMETVSMMLDDDTFIDEIQQFIATKKCNAEYAVSRVAESYAKKMENADSDYLKERSSDIRGVGGKLIDAVTGRKTGGPTELSAIAAAEISPAQLSAFDSKYIGGMITDKGSPNSHAAIIAGSLEIPYVYGAGEAIKELKENAFVILDGDRLVTDPDEAMRAGALERMARLQAKRLAEDEKLRSVAGECAGCRTKVYANIAGPKDIPQLLESGADGVGLFRSEFLFLDRDDAPSEDEQYQAYRAVLEAMGDKEVIIRTMDLGSDKKVPWLGLPDEQNPALGMRGVRVSLEKEDVFGVQLRALLRASVTGNLKIMFPMIASEWEIDEIKSRVDAAAHALGEAKVPYRVPEIGIMVETPAAAVMAEELAKKVSFFSIGTNDLTQYTLAIDREAAGLDRYFAPHHEAVLKLIEMTAAGGHKHGVVTGVCGQLAADSGEMTERLIAAGVDELSVPVSKVREVKAAAVMAEKKLAAAGGSGEPETGQEESGRDSKTAASGYAAVADGELIPMNEIPDPVFSSGQLGMCVGILPQDGKIYAPCDGVIAGIAETKHAVTIKADDGSELLIHAGIDTVKLGGSGFSVLVSEGDRITRSQHIMDMDRNVVQSAGLSDIIILARL